MNDPEFYARLDAGEFSLNYDVTKRVPKVSFEHEKDCQICNYGWKGQKIMDKSIGEIKGEAAANQLNTSIEKEFGLKDSGERKQFDSGMVRDVTTGKPEIHRVYDGPMLERWAMHITKGGIKYPDVKPGVPNWTLADGEEELARFKNSAARHFFQWMRGDTDEDHAAAVFFNLNGYEYLKLKLQLKMDKSSEPADPRQFNGKLDIQEEL